MKWVVEPTLILRSQVCANFVQLCFLTYFLDQITSGTVDISYVDETVKTILRTKFALGLFESTSEHVNIICV